MNNLRTLFATLCASTLMVFALNAQAPEELVNQDQPQEERLEQALDPDYTSHNGSYHRVVTITESGSKVQLEDGSVWEVRRDQWGKVQRWTEGDVVVITQLSSWSYSTVKMNFTLYNATKRDSIEIRGSKLPNGYDHTYTIREIIYDRYNPELVLDPDGTRWTLYNTDSHIWTFPNGQLKWYPGDIIIIGINNDWSPWADPNILINMNDGMKFVRSRSVN